MKMFFMGPLKKIIGMGCVFEETNTKYAYFEKT